MKRAFLTGTFVVMCAACSSESAAPAGAAGSSGADAAAATSTGAGGMGGATGTGGSGGTSGAGGTGGASDAGAGTLHGTVAVDLITDDHTGFLAVFFDGPQPAAAALDVRQSIGDCKLLVPRSVSCEPSCPISAACTGVNTCTERPKQVNVGILHVHGLGDMDLAIEPTSPTVLSYQAVPTLPYPPCSEGGDVAIAADGFALAGKCISALTVTSAVPIPVKSGQPTHLTWTAPGRAGISRVRLELEISHHGGYKGEIDCDVADTGSFDIPEPLITALVGLGRAGYPTIKIARTSTAAAPTQPNVKLVLSSQAELEVDTGVVSCGADGSPPCAAGTMCQPDYTCR